MASEPQTSDQPHTFIASQEETSTSNASGDLRGSRKKERHSFVDAVWEKFNDALAINECFDIYVPKKGPAKLTDSGHLILPRQLHMNDCGICEAGEPSDITRMCQDVVELDLTQNIITSWDEVFQVIRCMPHLTFLNLTNNPLKDSVIPIDAASSTSETTATTIISTSCSEPSFEKIEDKTISADRINANFGSSECAVGMKKNVDSLPDLHHFVLNDTHVDWPVVVRLLQLFPNLQELHLSLNQYTTVELSPQLIYPSLKRLFFNGNKVCAWSEINKLGLAFPNLEHLLLAETELNVLDKTDCMAEAFPSLTLLSLNKTQLEGWDVFDQLRLMPSLTDVRLLGIPFLEEIEAKKRRQQLVARLPNILRLNASPVTKEEREDAERAFIRQFMDSTDKPEREKHAFFSLRTTVTTVLYLITLVCTSSVIDKLISKMLLYYELEKNYGKLAPLAKVSLKPQTVFSVKILINDKCENLEVDANQSVRDLKKVLQNLVGLPVSRFSLYYLDKQINLGPEKLRYPDRMLYTYNLTDGDEFIIEPRN